jgi:hypothetical protein
MLSDDDQKLDAYGLFAFITGLEVLKKFQKNVYIKSVLRKALGLIPKFVDLHICGGGILILFDTPNNAVYAALKLRDFFRDVSWDQLGLPTLSVYIYLSLYEKFVIKDSDTPKEISIVADENLASKISELLPPNTICASSNFALVCQADDVSFKVIDEVHLLDMLHLAEANIVAWENELVDMEHILSAIAQSKHISQGLDLYPKTSKFGSRMLVSESAKIRISEYCVQSGFWKSEDVVFIESGTLPVFMTLALYRYHDPLSRPRLIVTNNITCSTITMMTEQFLSESRALYPDDKPVNSILVGGQILDDYAATIPEDLLDGGENLYLQSKDLIGYFQSKKINHIIMMVSKLNRQEGPCAVSNSMRRFKKLLLRYVTETVYARLSILAEADKLTVRRGWAADQADLPGIEFQNYWDKLLAEKKVEIISAISAEMTSAQIEMAIHEIEQLESAGAKCVLLGVNGRPMLR